MCTKRRQRMKSKMTFLETAAACLDRLEFFLIDLLWNAIGQFTQEMGNDFVEILSPMWQPLRQTEDVSGDVKRAGIQTRERTL